MTMYQNTLFPELELDTGEKRKNAGIELAKRSVEKIHPDWYVNVTRFAVKWFEDENIRYFQIEDLRRASKDVIPEPKDRRSWGAVPDKLRKLGLIVSNKLSTRKEPSGHGGYCTEWKVL